MRGALAALLWGCSGAEEDPTKPETTDLPEDTATDTWVEPPPYDPQVTTTDNGDGTFSTLVQATDADVFTYLSLSAGGLRVGDPTTTDPPTESWDLAYRRDEIRINGGVTGDGAAEAAILEGITLESIAWAPLSGYTTDEPDSDGDDRADGPFSGWFLYDINTHTLSPADQTYVLRTPQGAWRIRMDDYYWQDNSGWPSFTWAPLTEPGPVSLVTDEGGHEAMLLSPVEDGPVFLVLDEQMALQPASPTDSAEWDLSIEGTEIASNGGVSGSGGRTVAPVALPFDDVVEMPLASAFVEDAPDADADGIPEFAVSGWYDIDPYTYEVIPRPDTTFVLQRPDTSADKLAIVSYQDPESGDSGFVTLRTAILQEAPEEETTLP